MTLKQKTLMIASCTTAFMPTFATKEENKCNLSDDLLLQGCQQWIKDLCESGRRKWSLQVPVNFNKDPDMLFIELMNRYKDTQSELTIREATIENLASTIVEQQTEIGLLKYNLQSELTRLKEENSMLVDKLNEI